MGKVGRPAAIGEEHLQVLRTILSERRGATMDELCAELRKRSGLAATTVTLRNSLRRAGLERVKTRVQRATPAAKRYGYKASHRVPSDADK